VTVNIAASPFQDEAVVLLGRLPERGCVLPMFAESAGEEQALIAYEALIDAATKLLLSLPVSLGKFVAIDREVSDPEFQRWFGETPRLMLPTDDDRGVQLKSLSDRLFSQGSRRIVIIDLECPWITKLHIVQTLLSLKGSDLVLGPASTGGLYLLGLSKPLPPLFESLTWASRFFMDDARERLRADNLGWTEIAPLRVIETPGDWEEFQRSQRR
jgi:glycosyltransferase A (GT-A) superfamily protein (DUF2064 family)